MNIETLVSRWKTLAQDAQISANQVRNVLVCCIILGILYLVSQENYLFFHSSVEIFSVLVAWAIFIIAWNTEKYSEQRHMYYLGIAYLFIGVLDFIHTLAYDGMGVFPDTGANLATQLWILARYMESISLLIFPLMLDRQCPKKRVFLYYASVMAFFCTLIVIGLFPIAFVAGEGLTPFKIISEYIIIAFLIGALVNIRGKSERLETVLKNNLTYAIIFTIFAELAFTLYVSVYGFSNFVGHILKIASFYFIYRGIIVTNLEKPREFLVQTLENSQKRITETNKFLRVINSILIHDLLNDLTNIRFSIELMEAGDDIDTVGIAKRATDKGINLINRMSDLETLIGRDDDLKPTSLKDMILEILNNDVLYRDKEISIQGDCEPRVDNAMYSVLDNILRNAILHSETKKIEVTFEEIENKCLVHIIDYGKGIPNGIKERIFDAGYSGSALEISLGIGLSIVKNVIERYGGSVRVIDTIPSGVTFVLELNI